MKTKLKTVYVCSSCQATFPAWSGQCGSCLEWNTLSEQQSEAVKPSVYTADGSPKKPVPLLDISIQDDVVMPTTIPEFDRVLGGGLTVGSVNLIGGEPGIGKSTLALQVLQYFSLQNRKVLYVTAEESEKQLYLRANRLGESGSSLHVYAQTDIAAIISVIKEMKPDCVILDSIQVVYHADVSGAPGTMSQVRHCATEFIRTIKENGLTGLIIGHITKDGSIAGPKVLEHLVDVILYFEGERHLNYRLLRCFKNRFAASYEVGLFTMEEAGLLSADVNSSLFLDDVTLSSPGSVIVPVMEGSRVLLVELQALVVHSGYGMGKRTFQGVDANRATLMIAAMDKVLELKLFTKDIFLNVIGGLKITETCLDLAIIVSIMSSLYMAPLKRKIGVIGEVGLTGEVRAVSHVAQRVKELENMGFDECILPLKTKATFPKGASIKPIYVETVLDVIRELFPSN